VRLWIASTGRPKRRDSSSMALCTHHRPAITPFTNSHFSPSFSSIAGSLAINSPSGVWFNTQASAYTTAQYTPAITNHIAPGRRSHSGINPSPAMPTTMKTTCTNNVKRFPEDRRYSSPRGFEVPRGKTIEGRKRKLRKSRRVSVKSSDVAGNRYGAGAREVLFTVEERPVGSISSPITLCYQQLRTLRAGMRCLLLIGWLYC
jgi:hypothetical protein